MSSGLVCPVCSASLDDGPTVSCEKCQTPMHSECWEYWGRCARFACVGMVRSGALTATEAPAPQGLEARDGGPERYLPLRPMVGAAGALLYSTAGAFIRLEPGEAALELPGSLVPELPIVRRFYRPWAIPVLVMGIPFVALPLMGLALLLDVGRWAVGAALLAIAASILWIASPLKRLAPAPHAWLVLRRDRRLYVEVSGDDPGGRWDALFRRRLEVSPTSGGSSLQVLKGFLLRRAHGDGAEKDVPKAYRLMMGLDMPDGGLDIVAPLRIPQKGESRREFLDRLDAMRSMGRQLAGHFQVAYAEMDDDSDALDLAGTACAKPTVPKSSEE